MPVFYSHVAWCYDAIASAYSLGAIDRAKRWHVGLIGPGDRVLYVGAGTGREIALACAAGAEVLCLEPCEAMARRLLRRLAPWADRVTVLEEPLLAAEGTGSSSGAGGGGFDWVCGHFFFNVFDTGTMPEVLAMAASHVRPGGRVVVADFAGAGAHKHTRLRRDGGQDARPTDLWQRVLRTAYYRPVNLAGWALRMCALHPIYDYAPLLEGLGFEVESRTRFRVLPGLPGLYETLVARRV